MTVGHEKSRFTRAYRKQTIKVIAASGRLLQVLGQARAGKGPGVFDRPEGVEIRGRDLWFADTYNNRIVRYRVQEKQP
jgi:hypothetical protein